MKNNTSKLKLHYRAAKGTALVGIIFWLVETAYFGWNQHASSDAERWCDNLVYGIFMINMLLMLLCLVELIEWRIGMEQRLLDAIKPKDEKPLDGMTDDDLEPLHKHTSYTLSVFKDGEIKPLPCDCEAPCDGCKGLPGVQCQNLSRQ